MGIEPEPTASRSTNRWPHLPISVKQKYRLSPKPTPENSDQGIYNATFAVSDNEHTVTKSITISTFYIKET